MDIRQSQLLPNSYYHLFNRGVNKTNIFLEEKNYSYFLEKYSQYVYPFVDTFAYCLLPNHFHFLIRVKSEQEIFSLIEKNKELPLHWHVSNAISSCLKSYSQSMNKAYKRTGPLFEKPFKRIEVKEESYFSQLISYIHRNPEHHGLVNDFKVYPHSSYWSLLVNQPTKLEKQEVLDWFGGSKQYEKFHEMQLDTKKIQALLIEP